MNQELDGEGPQEQQDQVQQQPVDDLQQQVGDYLVELILIFSFQVAGDDGDLEVQQVIEEQIMAGQGGNQLTSQEFEERFFEQS